MKRDSSHLLIAVEAIGMVFIVAAIGSFIWGASELIGGIFSLAVRGHYPFEPFWQTLGLAASPHWALAWDRVWWLLVIVPLVLLGFAEMVGEFATEAAKGPRQRASDRAERRRSDSDFAKSEQQRRLLKRFAQERGPMNGWQRLGVVLSVLFGVPTFLGVYSDNTRAWGTVYPSQEVRALEGQAFWNALYRQAEQADPEMYGGCIRSTIRMEAPTESFGSYSVTCEKSAFYAASRSILWAFLPAAIIWTIGLTVAWVAAGFKRRPR